MELDIAYAGYSKLKRLETGDIAGISKLIFTVGLFVGITPTGYRWRYCFPDEATAIEALANWNGTGDPIGPWIVQKGRGVDRQNPETIAFRGIPIVHHQFGIHA